jgi:hypothetical protein
MNSIFSAWLANVRFAGEVHQVITSRIGMLTTGDARSATEAVRMLSEKAAALAEAQIETAAAVMTGQSLEVTMSRCFAPYRRRVRANSRRLRNRTQRPH